MRWPWSPKLPVIHLDPEMHTALKQWADTRKVPLDDLVRDVFRAILPTRFQAGAPDPGKAALDAAFALVDEADREAGIFPPPEIAPPTAAHPCLHLHPETPAMFRPGECSGTCHHPTQTGRPCFWPGLSARLCGLYQPPKNSP